MPATIEELRFVEAHGKLYSVRWTRPLDDLAYRAVLARGAVNLKQIGRFIRVADEDAGEARYYAGEQVTKDALEAQLVELAQVQPPAGPHAEEGEGKDD